ncbi:unnamed protein product [Moneuplotes crassus]|uniref:Uncharacterized protein n=1 Tax=Euplotes crassus TaxID=5936 RepID=A0AAD1XY24_EUPCR|nr:unnamed protein product [Moneuplotes crassus]
MWKSFEIIRPTDWDQSPASTNKRIDKKKENFRLREKKEKAIFKKPKLTKMNFEEGISALRDKLISGTHQCYTKKNKQLLKLENLNTSPIKKLPETLKLKKSASNVRSGKLKKSKLPPPVERRENSLLKIRRYSNLAGGDRVSTPVRKHRGWNLAVQRIEVVQRRNFRCNSKKSANRLGRIIDGKGSSSSRSFRRISVQVSPTFQENMQVKIPHEEYDNKKFEDDMYKISEMIRSNEAEGTSIKYNIRDFLGDELNALDESDGETESSKTQSAALKLKYVNKTENKSQNSKPCTNWGKRNGKKFLNKVEELKQQKVDPSYLKVKKPNEQILVSSIMTGLRRENLKPEKVQKKGKEYTKKLEEKAMKKNVSVPVFLFRRYGLNHPEDKSANAKAKIFKAKERAIKKRDKFYDLCNEDSTKKYNPNKFKVKDMTNYIGNQLFINLKSNHQFKGLKSTLKLNRSKTSRITHTGGHKGWMIGNDTNAISLKIMKSSRKGTSTTRTRTPSKFNRKNSQNAQREPSGRRISSQQSSRIRPVSSINPYTNRRKSSQQPKI